jgi:hypothetical protein
MLHAPVPRNLRVRSSIQLSSTRVPARTFLIVAGLIFGGGLMVVAGADVVRTLKLTGILIIVSLIVFELRCWGRSMREIARILARHYRRQSQLRLDPSLIRLPLEKEVVSAARAPRWQDAV